MQVDLKRCLVSILIPCHNAERWIREAVESALAQTWQPVEVIVVDDGSSDGSRAILAEFGDRIVWEAQPQLGPNPTRNRLLHLARGKWLQYLDADDYLLPEKIERQLVQSQSRGGGSPVDIIYSPVLIEEWRDGGRTPLRAEPIDPDKDLFEQWFSWQLPQTGGALWRAESLRELGGWNEAMPCCQEHELYLRALKNGRRFQFVAEPGAVYRIWSEKTVCRKNPLKVLEVKDRLFDDLVAWLRSNGLWTEGHRRTAGSACFRMARTRAKHDIAAAAAYFEMRSGQDLICADGVPVPATHRLLTQLFGFAFAEKIAAWKRRLV